MIAATVLLQCIRSGALEVHILYVWPLNRFVGSLSTQYSFTLHTRHRHFYGFIDIFKSIVYEHTVFANSCGHENVDAIFLVPERVLQSKKIAFIHSQCYFDRNLTVF